MAPPRWSIKAWRTAYRGLAWRTSLEDEPGGRASTSTGTGTRTTILLLLGLGLGPGLVLVLVLVLGLVQKIVVNPKLARIQVKYDTKSKTITTT